MSVNGRSKITKATQTTFNRHVTCEETLPHNRTFRKYRIHWPLLNHWSSRYVGKLVVQYWSITKSANCRWLKQWTAVVLIIILKRMVIYSATQKVVYGFILLCFTFKKEGMGEFQNILSKSDKTFLPAHRTRLPELFFQVTPKFRKRSSGRFMRF